MVHIPTYFDNTETTKFVAVVAFEPACLKVACKYFFMFQNCSLLELLKKFGSSIRYAFVSAVKGGLPLPF